MFLLRVPFSMREVVHVVIHPEFGGEVHLDGGLGDGVEEFLFEGVARGADGVDKDGSALEGAGDAGDGIFGVGADGEFGAVVEEVGWWCSIVVATLSRKKDDFGEAVA